MKLSKKVIKQIIELNKDTKIGEPVVELDGNPIFRTKMVTNNGLVLTYISDNAISHLDLHAEEETTIYLNTDNLEKAICT